MGRNRPVPGGGVCKNYRPRPAEPGRDARQIPLGDGYYAYVDAAEYEGLSQWCARILFESRRIWLENFVEEVKAARGGRRRCEV